MKFEDIRQMTRPGSYRVNVSWAYLEVHLADWMARDQTAPLDLNPDFQRGHVWTKKQQTAYVEYILRGGMSGRDLHFNCTGWMNSYEGPFVIVDGLQRLTAVRAFLANNVPVFGGNLFKDFTDNMRIFGPDFIFCVNTLATKAEVLQWYLEMNTGGTPHAKKEIDRVRDLLDGAIREGL